MDEQVLAAPAAAPARRTALDGVEAGGEGGKGFGREGRTSSKPPDGITSRALYSDIITIAWPSVVELFLTQLTSMVDLMMVGQLGPWAITAVGLTTQPKFLMAITFMSLNVGATAMVARYRGAGQPEKANLILRQALLLTFIVGAVSSAVGYWYSRELILFMGAKDALSLEAGTAYFQVQMAGFLTVALASTMTATLRGVGDSKTAMRYNIVANVVNVIFNYLLIYGHFGVPCLGVTGAAVATVMGQTVSFFMALRAVTCGRKYLHLRFRDGFRPHGEALRSIFHIGFPAMLENIVMRAGMIVFSKMVADLGTVPFATHQVCISIQAMSFMNGQALAVSSTSLVGQSLGKRRPDMAQAYGCHAARVGCCTAVVLMAVFVFLGRPIAALYTNDEAVVLQSARILRFVALVQIPQAIQFIYAGALRGAGDTRSVAVVMFITTLLLRPALGWLFIYQLALGLDGAWIGVVIDQLIRSILIQMRYRSGGWKRLNI